MVRMALRGKTLAPRRQCKEVLQRRGIAWYVDAVRDLTACGTLERMPPVHQLSSSSKLTGVLTR